MYGRTQLTQEWLQCNASNAYLSTLRFWPEAADVGVATVVVAGAELLAGMVGEVDITRTFLSHNVKVVPSRWCLFSSFLSVCSGAHHRSGFVVCWNLSNSGFTSSITLTEVDEPRNVLWNWKKKFIFAWAPISIFKDGKNLPRFTCKSSFQNKGASTSVLGINYTNVVSFVQSLSTLL